VRTEGTNNTGQNFCRNHSRKWQFRRHGCGGE